MLSSDSAVIDTSETTPTCNELIQISPEQHRSLKGLLRSCKVQIDLQIRLNK
jgi:hypothetical protein